jgi:hypothetical protein
MDILGWVILALVVAGVVMIAVFGWDRYRGNRKTVSGGAEPTDEVFIDLGTGRRMRVWYDAGTGRRDYRPE